MPFKLNLCKHLDTKPHFLHIIPFFPLSYVIFLAYMEQTAGPAKRRYCLKCGYDAETAAVNCPQCHRRLRTTTETRIAGLFQTFGGVLLLGLMGFIAYWMLGIVREGAKTGHSRFTGTQEQLMIIFGIIGVVILFGFVSVITGAWQLIFGRRNKVFTWLAALFGIVLLAGALFVIFRF